MLYFSLEIIVSIIPMCWWSNEDNPVARFNKALRCQHGFKFLYLFGVTSHCLEDYCEIFCHLKLDLFINRPTPFQYKTRHGKGEFLMLK